MTDEQHPATDGSDQATDTPDKTGAGQCIFIGICAVIAVEVIWVGLGLGSGDDEPDADGIRHDAFRVCTDFVRDRLKAPSTASFRNFFQDDGEVVMTGTGDGPYTIRSTVDAENSFGASLRSDWRCVVVLDGDTWRLQDISID